jgi:hypothetical protein
VQDYGKRMPKMPALGWKIWGRIGEITSEAIIFRSVWHLDSQWESFSASPNYSYYQSEGICSIGSGAVESTIKQIDRRTKISGAQWKEDNVPQVLAHRCAYLNRTISP